MKITITYFFLFLLSYNNLYSTDTVRTYKQHRLSANTLEVEVSDGKYLIRPYSSHIIETSFIPSGEAFNPESHAVILEPQQIDFLLNEDENNISWTSEGIAVIIYKDPFRITYLYDGKNLIAEKNGYKRGDSLEHLEFSLERNEVLYGGGARALGMNRRGNRLELYNKAHYGYEEHSQLMNYTMPIVLSSKRYMIHFDNAPIGFLDLDSKNNNTLTYSTISGRKTYQVIAGHTWPELMDHYTRLTGRQPMPPRWTFGNFSSRFGYHSEEETRNTVELFLKDSIPLDAVVIDIYWFGAEIFDHMGNLDFIADSFPTPYEMMSEFSEKGIQTILVTEPFILTTSNRWQEAVDKNLLALDSAGNPYTYDFYFGNTGIIDIYNEQAHNWFWNVYKELTEKGVGGWWGDLGEPEVHPKGVIHATGSADEVHNIYGHDWARLIYEGYERDFPDQRPFILMRAGYSGSQRYGLIPWSGDVSRSWGGLVPQTEIALQMGMQGLAYMHSDLGGFGEGRVFDPELYTRWLQFGVFQPLFRPHAQEHIPAEPVFHDDKTKALAKQAIELRYSMLPYNYSLAFENSNTGMPLMRPLLFEEPDNISTWEHADSYLWGDAFLVFPITNSTTREQEIYLPATGNWVDFFTDEEHKGGQSIKMLFAAENIPVFVRSGSFIPMVSPVQSTSLYNTSRLTVHFYSPNQTQESSYRMYDDDGFTPFCFNKGEYEFLDFSASEKPEYLKISIQSKPGEHFQAPDRRMDFVVHRQLERPKSVFVDDTQVEFHWEEDKKLLLFSTDLKGGNDANILINK